MIDATFSLKVISIFHFSMYHDLKSVVYYSKAQSEFTESDLDDLSILASAKNRQQNITGFLNFSNGEFFQYLEGPAVSIDALMQTISKDKRHKIVYETSIKNFEKRRFNTWSMKFLTEEHLNKLQLGYIIEQNLHFIRTNYTLTERCKRVVSNYVNQMSLFHVQNTMYRVAETLPTSGLLLR